MRLRFLLLVSLLAVRTECREEKQGYQEELLLRHLPDGRVLASFQLTTSWDMHPLSVGRTRGPTRTVKVQHYGMFPKSLAEVVVHYEVQELHLSLTRGKWRTPVWGYPPLSAPPGAEFWVWFLPNVYDISSKWKGLVNAVSGLMCASLSAIEPTSTYQPPRSFRPQGAVFGNLSSSLLRYAALPREPVCTENLTPWTKLLPCGSKAGLGSLLTALKLYNAHYHSLSLHWLPVCKDTECNVVGIELRQQLQGVFDSDTSQGPTWSLASLFSGPLPSSCPLASRSLVYVDTSSNLPATSTLSPQPSWVENVSVHSAVADLAVYNLSAHEGPLDVTLSRSATDLLTSKMPPPPLLSAHRFITGSGHEWGGLYTEIINSHTHSLRTLFLDMVPWYFRVMLHTLEVSCVQQSSQEKEAGSVQFSRSFLKWTEYPPDAAHGFYINSAVLTTVLDQCLNCTPVPVSMTTRGWDSTDGLLLQLHTDPLLVSLPTPDFSMPYNVICFVSTVVAIAFGTLLNLTTKTLQPVPEDGGGGKKFWQILGK